MKIARFWPILLALIPIAALVAGDVNFSFAEDGSDGHKITKEVVVEDPDPLDNTLNPDSPKYNPAHLYGAEGSRFGPPGKRFISCFLR